jgi:hypothetical protein
MIIEHEGESFIRLSTFIDIEMNPLVMAPWNGNPVPVKLRRLNYTQIRSCGDFSLIETVSDVINKKKKPSESQILSYMELQHEIVKMSLMAPTYDEIMKLSEYDPLRVEAEKELDSIEQDIESLPPGPKKSKLEKDLLISKIELKSFLPSDFVGHIMNFALKIDDSDIKLITEDMLYNAAVLAKNGSGNPSDHLPGNFTDFNKVDINNRAWVIFHNRSKEENGSTNRRR